MKSDDTSSFHEVDSIYVRFCEKSPSGGKGSLLRLAIESTILLGVITSS